MIWMMQSNWTYQGKEITEVPFGYVGFVYKITTPNGKFYIGQKLFNFKRTKVVKGTKVRRTVESDWVDYYGSSDEVKQMVVDLGPENFKREILYFCQSKSVMNYVESTLILSSGALLSEQYLNKWVSVKINASTVVGKINEHFHFPAFDLIEKEVKPKRIKK
jgi:hypothetical protein